MFSLNVDWQDEKWDFVGRDCYSDKQIENDPDLGQPMMNYAYPLENFSGETNIIKKINKRTGCTVVYDREIEEYYLAWTGGGMDLSQDIALAYMIAQGFIEWDLVDEVYTHAPLSISETNYIKIMKELLRQHEINESNAKRYQEEIKKHLEELKAKQKERKLKV